MNLLSSLVLTLRVKNSIRRKEAGEINNREEASPTTGLPDWDGPKLERGKNIILKSISNIFNNKERDSFFFKLKNKRAIYLFPLSDRKN